MIGIIIAYGILISFFAMDFVIRKDKNAKSVKDTKYDKKSTILILATFVIVLFVSAFLNLLHIGQFANEKAALLGISVMLLGMIIRIHSMLTLSLYYTRTLVIIGEQDIVKNGLYKIIRHPGYLGTILVWGTAGLAMQNILVFLLSLLMIVTAYCYRIYQEEKMLVESFGEIYTEYKKNTWRLIPFIW